MKSALHMTKNTKERAKPTQEVKTKDIIKK